MNTNRSTEKITIVAVVLTVLAVVLFDSEVPHGFNHVATPCRTSILSGHAWFMELMDRPNERAFQESFRMKQVTFHRIYSDLQNIAGLRDSRYVSLYEQVAIFCFITGHNASSRLTQERFQHSGETIHRYVLTNFTHIDTSGQFSTEFFNSTLLPYLYQQQQRLSAQISAKTQNTIPISKIVLERSMAVIYQFMFLQKVSQHTETEKDSLAQMSWASSI